MPFLVFHWDHLRSNLGIISGLGIICGWGSFAALYPTDLKNKQVCLMLKKWRIVVNRISKVRKTTCNWIKKILDEATRIVNVFLISWFFYLFLLCSISLLVMYQSNWSLNIPPGIPRAFDVFCCLGGREFDELSPPRDGAFDHCS